MKYKLLTDLYQNVESTSKRLEKTYYLSNFLKQVPDQELEQVILLLQGKVFAQWDDRKIGVAVKLVVRAIQLATGIEAKKIEQEWKNTGDLGKTAENLVKNKKQGTLFSAELSVKKVFNNIQKLATVEGVGSVDLKVKLVSELLSSAKPREARYVIRTVLEDLRVGIGDGIIRDSIVWVNFAD
ncbi:MAG: DNA ligase, partial [Candidatus Nanoarchaeia archaeon]